MMISVKRSVSCHKSKLKYLSLIYVKRFEKHFSLTDADFFNLKSCLHFVGRIARMCLRPCPKERNTALQVSIAKISCERLLLSKTSVTM